MYELITRDVEPRSVRHEEQDLSTIESSDWVKHPEVLLDHPVSDFRRVLDEWCARRRSGEQITLYTEAPRFLDWPPLPEPPTTEIETRTTKGPVKRSVKRYSWRRNEPPRDGKPILNWERPPQRVPSQ